MSRLGRPSSRSNEEKPPPQPTSANQSVCHQPVVTSREEHKHICDKSEHKVRFAAQNEPPQRSPSQKQRFQELRNKEQKLPTHLQVGKSGDGIDFIQLTEFMLILVCMN